MKVQLNADAERSYKVGIDEIQGLKAVCIDVMKPIQDVLNEQERWSGDGWFELSEAEYKSRDGFMAYSHNCGGITVSGIVPKCGESDFPFLEFGEYSEREPGMTDDEYDSARDSEESEGHLDAYLRIWLKFEGYDRETGELSFYLVMDGGNNDAPYFRTKHLPTLFEASFTCKSVGGIKRAASKHVKALLAIVQGGAR